MDANPPVKGIRWYRDGHLISNHFNHTISEAKISDSGVYSCQADNGIAPPVGAQLNSLHGQVVGPASSFFSLMSLASGGASAQDSDQISRAPTLVEAPLHLQVLYPPRVQVKASKSFPLSEGDFFSLNCSVDSSPPAHEFVWTKQDDPTFRRLASQQSPLLDFQSVSASDSGNYTCTAFNRLDLSGHYQQIEKQASGSALVLVRHKPGIAEISLGQAGETELGAKTLIQCRAKPPGYPEPQYKFWKFQGSGNQRLHLNKQAHGSTYTIYSAKADDEAKYGCMATNEMGVSSEADGDLIVNEPPSIIRDSARRDEDARPPGEFPYSITVRATGKPEPKVSWFHRSPVDGRRIELGSLEMQSRFKVETITKTEQNQMRLKYNVVSTLTFKMPLEVDDRGLYTVEFSNGLSRTAIEDFQLHINHAPIPAPRNQPIIAQTQAQGQQQSSGTRTKAGFDLGETVNLTCRVSAYPKPEFLWYANSATESDKPIETNSRYRTSISNPRDDIWESTLTFSQAQQSDYGEYMCVTANHDQQTNRISDSVQILVNLSRKTSPDPPSQLEAVDASQDSITLQWLAGFDGGFAQNQFLVQYALDDGTGQSLSKRFPGSDSSLAVAMASLQQNQLEGEQAANYPRLYDCLTMNPCTINQLLPRQAYSFRVRARNELGASDYSDELRATTRANISSIPRILDASFDSSQNMLYFRIEPGSDYLLNNLNARIEVRTSSSLPLHTSEGQRPAMDQLEVQEMAASQQQQQQAADSSWRFFTVVPIRQERAQAYLNMSNDTEQLRLTLCSRSNESLCGPEFVISKRSATSSFLHDQRGSLLSILMSTLSLIVVMGAFATTVHSCCLSGKNKKAESIERADANIDNKPNANGAPNQLPGINKSSHGSTTSTNSTSANGTNGLQSMDSINGPLGGVGGGGGVSDHSSDHSRQAKLDSMLPPNYNHYADRASIMMEQQQQHQHQQLLQQQQGIIADKLGSPFGLPNGALLGVAGQQQQQQQLSSPMINGTMGHFSYGRAGQVADSQGQQQQPMSLEQQMLDGSMMLGAAYDPDGQQQIWPAQLDDYSNYNALGYATAQQGAQEQVLDPTYATTGSVMMSQQSAAYDNSANSSQFQSYVSAYQQQEQGQQQYQQRTQYQQEMAAAQQQMYGTLTRNGYSGGAIGGEATGKPVHQLAEQQQQHYSTGGTNGLVQPPQLPPPVSQSQVESDYGTTGGRAGRLIREIIV